MRQSDESRIAQPRQRITNNKECARLVIEIALLGSRVRKKASDFGCVPIPSNSVQSVNYEDDALPGVSRLRFHFGLLHGELSFGFQGSTKAATKVAIKAGFRVGVLCGLCVLW